jgi:hypothetical protein
MADTFMVDRILYSISDDIFGMISKGDGMNVQVYAILRLSASQTP